MIFQAVDYIGVFYNVESFLQQSLVEILVDECVFEDPDFTYIKDGMDLLPRAMANDLGNAKIQFNSKVTTIDQKRRQGRVLVTFDCKGIDCPEENNPVEAADVVIVTASAGVTLGIDFVPRLPPAKEHALRTANYGSSTKVILVFERPFWEDRNRGQGGAHMTDLPVKQIYYQMERTKTGNIIFQH